MKNVLESIKVRKIFLNAYSVYVETPTVQAIFDNFTFDALPFEILGATWQETNDWYVYETDRDDFTYSTKISAWYTVKDKITGDIYTLDIDEDGFFGTDRLYFEPDLPETNCATYTFLNVFLALRLPFDETIGTLDDLDENDFDSLRRHFWEMIQVFYKRKTNAGYRDYSDKLKAMMQDNK